MGAFDVAVGDFGECGGLPRPAELAVAVATTLTQEAQPVTLLPTSMFTPVSLRSDWRLSSVLGSRVDTGSR